MNARRARLVAIPLVLLSFVVRLAYEVWGWPVGGRGGAFLVFAGGVLVPFGLYLMVCRGVVRRPGVWRVDGGRFVAGASAVGAGLYAGPLGWLFAGLVGIERGPGAERARLAPLGGFRTVELVVCVILLVGTVVLLVSNRPRLALDSQGITLLTAVGRRGARWDELQPGHPQLSGRRLAVVDAVRRTASGSRRWRLPAARLDIDPGLLAHTIRFYTDVPGARGRIGSEEGRPSWP